MNVRSIANLPARQFNRRKFLGASAGLVGALAAAGETPNADRRLTVGFLGTSHSHFAAKYRLLSASPDFELIGVCDDDSAVRARGPQGARWMSRKELFAGAEVIVVEGAVVDHARDAREALQAGRHVHVEKPPADSLVALQELVQMAAEKKRLLQVGYMWRYHPGFNAAIKAAQEGWLGDVFLVRGMINTYGNREQRRDWAQFPGGILFELGCHLIDPLVRLLGIPTRINSVLQHVGDAEDDLADNTVATFEYPRALGVISSAVLQINAGSQRSFELSGTNGTARIMPLEPPTLVLELAAAAGPHGKGRHELSLPTYQRYTDEFTALARAIRTGQPLPVSSEQELAIQAALLQACRM